MAHSSQLANISPDGVLYENCSAETLLEGEKCSSIIGYAINAMGINVDAATPEDMYDRYTKGLTNKLQSSEPYITSVKMKELSKDKIIRDMKGILPYRIEKFDKLIESAADRAVQVLSTDPEGFSEVIHKSRTNEIVFSEFSVLKVFKAGENLEIVPCYLYIKGKRSEGRTLFLHSWKETEATMYYKQQKYVLTKFDIKGIIQKLAANSNRW